MESPLPGKVLVTGGLGFIGSHLVDALVEAGCRVTILDDLSTGKMDNLLPKSRNSRIIVSDVASEGGTRRAVQGVDAVVHLAALTGVRRKSGSSHVNRVNVRGTRVLLDACVDAKVKTIVFASSVAVYGERRRVGVMVEKPASVYGRSKLRAERLFRLYEKKSTASLSILRFANVYGPRMPERGEDSVMVTFARAALRGEHFPIFGDGSQTRDFVHVQDVVNSITTTLALSPHAMLTLDIGTGVPTSVYGLANLFMGRARRRAPIDRLPEGNEVRNSYADTVSARRTLGFEAKVPLAKGVSSLLDWYRSNNAPSSGEAVADSE